MQCFILSGWPLRAMGKGKQENGWSDWNVWRGKAIRFKQSNWSAHINIDSEVSLRVFSWRSIGVVETIFTYCTDIYTTDHAHNWFLFYIPLFVKVATHHTVLFVLSCCIFCASGNSSCSSMLNTFMLRFKGERSWGWWNCLKCILPLVQTLHAEINT